VVSALKCSDLSLLFLHTCENCRGRRFRRIAATKLGERVLRMGIITTASRWTCSKTLSWRRGGSRERMWSSFQALLPRVTKTICVRTDYSRTNEERTATVGNARHFSGIWYFFVGRLPPPADPHTPKKMAKRRPRLSYDIHRALLEAAVDEWRCKRKLSTAPLREATHNPGTSELRSRGFDKRYGTWVAYLAYPENAYGVG